MRQERHDQSSARAFCTITRRIAPVLAVLMAMAALPGSALGQGFEVDRFLPSSGHRTGYITMDSGQSHLPGSFEVSERLYYLTHNLLGYIDHEEAFILLDEQLVSHTLFAYSPFNFLRVWAHLPIYLYQSGLNEQVLGLQDGDLDVGGRVGDVRLGVKFTIYDGRDAGGGLPRIGENVGRQDGIAVSLLASIPIPSGQNTLFQGEDGRIEPTIAVDYAWENGMGVGANLGFLFRENKVLHNIEVSDQFTYEVAFRSPRIIDMISLIGELSGAQSTGADQAGLEESPLEALFSGRLEWTDWVFDVGFGFGLVNGYGAPDTRTYLAASYSPEAEQDRDGDGCLDSVDACPLEPEDFDGWEDDDCCPDPDNDQDGYLDIEDGCPNDPEDFDGFEDEDGCPDPDNDQDGILDINDDCPNDPEDFDGWEDEDGCPDPDNDEDGILDIHDACPNEPEDFDGFEDEDGCPEPGPILPMLQRIQFAYDSARILEESYPLLDEDARVIREHPELTLIEVQGHTSTEGSDEHNMGLSRRRAQAVVDALVERGVERRRLVAEGYGETQPIIPNEVTEAQREVNRRVEFRVLEAEPTE